MHLLIPYLALVDHPDPLFDEFTYGDVGQRAAKLKKDLRKGDFVFFHTTSRGEHYVTSYYVVDRMLDTRAVTENKLLMQKYHNPHLKPGRRVNREDVILFGDPISSRKLNRPLPFGRSLAEKLSLEIRFPSTRSELASIGSATRAWRELTDEDKDTLLDAIEERKTGLHFRTLAFDG